MFFMLLVVGIGGALQNGKELVSASGPYRKELNEQDEPLKIEGYLNEQLSRNLWIYARIDCLCRQVL